MKKIKKAVAVACLIAGVVAFQSALRAEENSGPKTPFSVQMSATGTGISGVYRFNGPTADGPYAGVQVALQSISGVNNAGSQSRVGGWLGMRKQIEPGLYYVFGGEVYTTSGSNMDGYHIDSAVDGGAFVGIHKYLDSHWYVSLYTNPVYMSQVTLTGDSQITKYSFFTGGVGVGYQF
jgi:hypothetical protein